MAINKRNNKFEDVVEELHQQDAVDQEKSGTVIKGITGEKQNTKTIVDKNGRTRTVKVVEKRKTMPVYIPDSLYNQFEEITAAYGVSRNAAICQLIRDYVQDKKGVLDDLK